MLPQFFHRSVRESKVIAAAINPIEAPPLRDLITKVKPQLSTLKVTDTETVFESIDLNPKRDSVKPLTADLSRLNFTVSDRVLKKLDAVKAALSHKFPKGRPLGRRKCPAP